MASPVRRHAKHTGPGVAGDLLDTLPGSSPLHSDWRDWASLMAGPAGLIAERALANDLVDYVRFRAVCTAWRACSLDPRESHVSDRQFHPRQWIMLPSSYMSQDQRRQCFLNIHTGKRIHVCLPDLRGYNILGTVVEGLLVLYQHDTRIFQLLNPLTGQLTDFPPVETTGVSKSRRRTTGQRVRNQRLRSGCLADDSTVALLPVINKKFAVAKPRDKNWTLLKTDDYTFLAFPFAGRVYCVTEKNILVVETGADEVARVMVVAELKMRRRFRFLDDYFYPVYDKGGLILVHRHVTNRSYFDDEFAAYRVELVTGNMELINNLGGQALFACGGRSVSVNAEIFSPNRADTVYVCRNDPDDEEEPQVIAFDLSSDTCCLLNKEDVPNCLFDYVCS